MAKGSNGEVFDFEKALAELEQIVKELEGGNAGLDKSIQLFQRGVELAKQCKVKLDEAETKVLQLTKEKDGVFSEVRSESVPNNESVPADGSVIPKDQLDDIPF